MNKPICYVGVDVGKAELWVAVADRRPRRFAHKAVGVRSLVRFCHQAAPDCVLHFCMEATGVYGRSLAVRLLEDGADLQVSIVNPAQIAAFGRAQLRRTKTDAVDAQVILAFARSQTPSLWTPEPVVLRELNQLVKEAEALQTTRTQWSNRSAGLRTPSEQHAHAWNADQPAAVRQTDRAMLRMLDRLLARLAEAIDALCQRDPQLRRRVAVLCSIPGIGRKSAIRVLAHGQLTLMTHSPKQLTAHAGLAPRHRLSGTSVRGKSHLAKQGNAHLRRALYMAALVASRHNPAIKPVYDRLRERGKPGKLALAAPKESGVLRTCMRRLLLIIRALLRDDRTFEPEYARS